MAQTSESVFFTAPNPSSFCSESSVSRQHDVHPGAGAETSAAFSSCCHVSPCRPGQGPPPPAISQRGAVLQGQPSRLDVRAAALRRLDKRPTASVSCLSAGSALVHGPIKDVLWCQSSSVRRHKQEKCFTIKERKNPLSASCRSSRPSPGLDLNLSDSTLITD